MASVQIGFRQLQILKYAISTSPDGLLPSLSFSLPILGYNLLNFDMLAGVRCYNLESKLPLCVPLSGQQRRRCGSPFASWRGKGVASIETEGEGASVRFGGGGRRPPCPRVPCT